MKKNKKAHAISTYKNLKKQLAYQSMIIPGIIFCIIFCYMPMLGIIIAFEDFNFRKGFLGSEWVGLKYFNRFFNDVDLLPVVYNTLVISSLIIVFSFFVIIIFTLLLRGC